MPRLSNSALTCLLLLLTVVGTFVGCAEPVSNQPPGQQTRDTNVNDAPTDVEADETGSDGLDEMSDSGDLAVDTLDDLETDIADVDAEDADAEDMATEPIPALDYGEPCEANEECLSGFCVHAPAGELGRVCSTACTNACPDEDFTCWAMFSRGGRDLGGVCQAVDSVLCSECETDGECGAFNELCLPVGEGFGCATECDVSGSCPVGFYCSIESRPGVDAIGVCRPEGDSCPECMGIDLMNDPFNCGSCGYSCVADNSAAECVEGECVLDCVGTFDNCDNDPETGCETDLAADTNCGSCAVLDGVPGTACGTCDTGNWVCDGTDNVICEGDAGTGILNECDGCTELPFSLAESCGTCESGYWDCFNTESLTCVDDGGEEAFNGCEGCEVLDGEPGTACGECGDDGLWVCNGREAVRCDDPTPPNECGGCNTLDDLPDTPCGTCDRDHYVCVDGGESTICSGDTRNICGGCDEITITIDDLGTACGTCDSGLWQCEEGDAVCADDIGPEGKNSCGGCTTLPEEDTVCGDCGEDGRWECNGLEAMRCVDPTPVNVCGGCATLDNPPDSVCGTCDLDQYVCAEGGETTVCGGDTHNICGGCGEITIGVDDLGTACGACNSGSWQCEAGDAVCAGDVGEAGTNGCGGCNTLPEVLDTACGVCGDDGRWVCNGVDAVRCDDPTEENECGGCTTLLNPPDTGCGPCGVDVYVCGLGGETTVCGGETTNACGGCLPMETTPDDLGEACGTCDSGSLACDGENAVTCDGDQGEAAENACGGCDELEETIGEPCGPCNLDEWACLGEDGVECDDSTACPPVTCRLSGEITLDEITLEMSPCVIEADVTVPIGHTLTVEPGVVFKFEVTRTSRTDDRDFSVFGDLIAEGTAEQPIIFTSFRDDTHAGDSNEDGDDTAPATGDWGRLRVPADTASRLSYIEVYWGGGGNTTTSGAANPASSAAFEVDAAIAPEMDHITVANSQARGALLTVTGGFDWSLSESIFRNNATIGLDVWGSPAPITLAGIDAHNNGTDGIVVVTAGPLTMSGLDVEENGRTGVELDTSGHLDLTDSFIANHPDDTNLIVIGAAPGSTIRNNEIVANNSRVPGRLEVVASVVPDLVQEMVDFNTLTNTDRGLHVRRGTVNLDATWANPGFEYAIDGDVTVASGAELTLEPGLIAKFIVVRTARVDDADLRVAGTLNAVGTAEQPIIFTSQRDDDAGIDMNGDAVSSSPATGDWGRIWFASAGTGHISHAEIRWGGGGNTVTSGASNPATSAALEVDVAIAPELDNLLIEHSQARGALLNVTGGFDWSVTDSVFRSNSSHGLEITGGAAPLMLLDVRSQANGSSGLIISTIGQMTLDGLTVDGNAAAGVTLSTTGTIDLTDSFITDHGNSTGLTISSASAASTVRNNTVSGANVVASVIPNVVQEVVDFNTLSDTDRGLYVRGGSLTNSDTWVEPGYEYLLIGDVTVAAGTTLTLDPGVVVKSTAVRTARTNDIDLIIDGELMAVGTEEDPIHFTSHRDDTVGGDTNGDGNATNPATGDWGRLLIRNAGTGTLSYVEIHWGGGGNTTTSGASNPAGAAAFEVSAAAAPTVDNITVVSSQSRGALYTLTGGFDWALDAALFQSNGGAGIEVSGGSGTMTFTDITSTGNGGSGVVLATTGSQTMSDLEVTSNGGDGLTASTSSTFNLSESTVDDHGSGTALILSAAGTVGSIENNTLSRADVVASLIPNAVAEVVSNNTLSETESGLHVRGGSLGVSSTWPDLGFEYMIDGDQTVAAGITLTLEAGVILKFKSTRTARVDDVDLFVDGILLANGTDGSPVVLTNAPADHSGGASNRNGAANSPASGDWGRVYIRSGGSSTLGWAELRYGGGGNTTTSGASNPVGHAGLSVSGSLDLDDTVVEHSQSDGIRIIGGSGTLDNASLSNNALYGIHFEGVSCDDWTVTTPNYDGNGSGEMTGCP